MISDVPKVPHLAIRELFTVLKMWNFLKNTNFSTSEQYKLSNFNLGPIVHPRNNLSRWKLDFLFNDHSQILVINCNHEQKPLWYIMSQLTVQYRSEMLFSSPFHIRPFWECVWKGEEKSTPTPALCQEGEEGNLFFSGRIVRFLHMVVSASKIQIFVGRSFQT